MTELLERHCPEASVAVLFNPASGQEDPAARRARLEALVSGVGLTCGLTETDPREGAVPAAREAVACGVERLIVSGGDGTVAEAASQLAGTEVVLGVVPGGTGNLLAVNLELPFDPQQAMRLAATGEPTPTDVGCANGKAFLIMAGIGADAHMIRDADRDLKNRLGFLAYFVAGWRHLARARTRFTVTVDGIRVRRHALTVLVANLGRVTGGIEIVPGADSQSGELRVAIVRTRNAWEVVRLAARALVGRAHTDDRLELLRGTRILIETVRPQPFQIDGNDAGCTNRLEISVQPGALRLVRPTSSTGSS